MAAYQSRSLTVISQQTRRLTDRINRALRHLKVAAVWGTQVLLYPVYLLFQTGRLLSRQLQQEIRQIQFELQAAKSRQPESSLTVDAPIQQVFEALPDLWVHPPTSHVECVQTESGDRLETGPDELAVIGSDALATAPLMIQAVASRLDDRNLVLVAPDNQVLDILTPDQQQQLQQHLIAAVAHYYYRLRMLHLRNQAMTTRLPLPPERRHLFLPVQLFRQAMAWMQRGTVATTIDLFHESALIRSAIDESWYEDTGEMVAPSQPMASIQPSQSSLSLPAAGDPLPPATATSDTWLSLTDLFDVPTQSTPDPQVIAALLQEQHRVAVAGQQLAQTPVAPAGELAVVQPSLKEPEPWLSLTDLFDLPAAQTPAPEVMAALLQDQYHQAAKVQGRKAEANGSAMALRTEQGGADVGVLGGAQVTSMPKAETQSLPDPTGAIEPTVGSQSVEVAPTWIEAEAQLVGYVKHPLERVIGWLDRLILWVETAVTTIVNWVGNGFRHR